MATAFYRLFLWLYRCGALVLSPFNEKANLWLSGRKDVFVRLGTFKASEQREIVWFHCASLGEFEQARPLLEEVRRRFPAYAILLSFFSPSGYEIRKNYTGADCVTYLPMDGPLHAQKFVSLIQPTLVIWVKYEYWHFYLRQIKQRNIPLLLVSGIFRPQQPFFKSWGAFHRNMLGCFTGLFVQNQESKRLLGSIGFSENVLVSGDTRFDRVIEIAGQQEALPLVEQFIGACPVVVAGSTWQEDEEAIDHFANSHPAIKFIIAPHEIDAAHITEIERLFQHSCRYSSLTTQTVDHNNLPDANVLIIDNIGVLSRLYKYATVAYVGGGFGNDGVHNVLEAAVYQKPVIFGPVYEKFAEAVGLVEAGGAFSVENALELEEKLGLLLNSRLECAEAGSAAGDFVVANKGATQKILGYIQEKRLLTS
ncbi:MAG: glycosyltransferase N-terminal domain-containing protein [Chitinophagaceae bacterium]